MTCPLASTALTLLLASQHHIAGDFNERHQGVGIEHPVNCNVAAVAGTFTNSHYKRTVYAGALYERHLAGPLHAGAVGVVGTGYPVPVGGALTLRAGPVRVLHVPAAVTALQLRMEF